MPRFQIGDIVRGTPESDSIYLVTNSSYVGTVTDIDEYDEEIIVLDDTHEVNQWYFELLEQTPTKTKKEEKIMKKNTLSTRNAEIVNIPDSGASARRIVLVKLKSKDELMAIGNSEKFSNIIADKYVLVDTYNSNRVRNDMNPHIKGALDEASIRNYRIDNFSQSYLDETYTLLEQYNRHYGNYYVDFVNGKREAVLSKTETVCPTCHSIVEKSALYGNFCLECLTKDYGLAYRFSYHDYTDGYTPNETVKDGAALFGCEIERDWISRNSDDDFGTYLKNAMARATMALHPELKKAKNVSDIKRDNVFMSDGSLRSGGCEWITFPHTYKYYKKYADRYQKALDIFKDNHFGNSSSVGNHIHINRAFFGKDAKFCAAKMALLLNSYWEEFKVIAKRSGTSYCMKPEQKKTDDLFELIEKTVRYQSEHSMSINLQHRDTIECRLWGGVDNVQDLLLYLDLTYAIAKTAKKSLTFCQCAKMTDVLKNLQDKQDHIPMIVERLRNGGKTTLAKEIETAFATIEETTTEEA